MNNFRLIWPNISYYSRSKYLPKVKKKPSWSVVGTQSVNHLGHLATFSKNNIVLWLLAVIKELSINIKTHPDDGRM